MRQRVAGTGGPFFGEYLLKRLSILNAFLGSLFWKPPKMFTQVGRYVCKKL